MMMLLQIEQLIVQRLVRIPFHRLSYEVGHFVRILTASGNSDASWPVVVQVAQLVAQPLQNVRRVVRLIVHHYVMRGRNTALADRLRHQEIIEMVASSDRVVQHRSRIWILQIVSVDSEHSGVDTLLDDYKRYLRDVVWFHKLTRFLKLWDFVLRAHTKLTIANAVSENDDFPWQLTICLLVRFQRLLHRCAQSVHEFLLFALNAGARIPSRVFSV